MNEAFLTPTVQPPFPLRWGFSTRQTDPEELPLKRIHQVHGCGIVAADSGTHSGPVDGDGIWTFERHLPIGVRVADCVPVLLAGLADGRPWIAALHAGWRGATAGILRQALSIYRGMGGRPRDLCFAFGPCIQVCHFEVGSEVTAAARLDPAWNQTLEIIDPSGRPHLDLHGLLRAQALHLDMDPALEGTIARCTYCEPETFYSYRRGEHEGRQWGLVERL